MAGHRGAAVGILGACLVLGATPAWGAPPGGVTAMAPTGVIAGSSITFTWQAASDATFYYLQVNDPVASPRFTTWYPAGQACPAASATCFVTLTTGFAAGTGTWWVRAWNGDGYGPWSDGLHFTVAFVPAAWAVTLASADRLVLGGQAVLDRETGLVWQRNPAAGSLNWGDAMLAFPDSCLSATTGARRGWRLPTIDELQSLMLPDFSLPAGHPFGANAAGDFWSATTSVTDSTAALVWHVGGGPAILGSVFKTNVFRWWCVRGPQGLALP